MIIPDHFAQVNLKFGGPNLPTGAEMTFGVNITGYAGGPADAGPDIYTAWTDASVDDLYVGDTWLASVLVKFGPNDTGAFAEYVVNAHGSAGNPGVPANTALLVKKVTSFGGRKGRGRMFLPGIQSSVIDPNGNLHSGFLTTALANLNDFLGKLGAAQLPMALLHGDHETGLAPYEVNVLDIGSKVATQRRRLRR